MIPNPRQSASSYHYDVSSEGVEPTRQSAGVVVPLVMDLFQPSSIVDVGCGLGDWLAEFKRHGCTKVVGYDGPWIPLENLQIARDSFRTVDFAQPLQISDRFDLAICLEVAEHVNETAAENLLDALSTSADIVLFSAAIPGQGGYMHINEHYPTFWIAKFAKRGFTAFDQIRPQIWGDDRVCWWYQQNMLLYANSSACERFGLVERPFMADVVHPARYDWARNPQYWGGKMMARALMQRIVSKLVRKSR